MSALAFHVKNVNVEPLTSTSNKKHLLPLQPVGGICANEEKNKFFYHRFPEFYICERKLCDVISISQPTEEHIQTSAEKLIGT